MDWDEWKAEWDRRVAEYERRVADLLRRAEVDMLELQFALPSAERDEP